MVVLLVELAPDDVGVDTIDRTHLFALLVELVPDEVGVDNSMIITDLFDVGVDDFDEEN